VARPIDGARGIAMPTDRFDNLLNQFHQTLGDCRRQFLAAAALVVQQHPYLLDQSPSQFTEQMEDLHRGLVIKLFCSIAGVDLLWSRQEAELARVLVFHLWNQRLSSGQVRDALHRLTPKAQDLEWEHLLRPFVEFDILRTSGAELLTIVVRLGNLIAKSDGHPSSLKVDELAAIQDRIAMVLAKPAGERRSGSPIDPSQSARWAMHQMQAEQHKVHDSTRSTSEPAKPSSNGEDEVEELTPEAREERLAAARRELDALIGMERVKKEVSTLVNFLQFQSRRRAAGLTETPMSLHMVFGGNPGTGKTTVARILGKIYGALGVLKRGHLVETDRSGLVAEYAGQTGPRTNAKIDESLDGILFIDEAYSLVSADGEDPYGREAVQAIVKRMEDDRKRLVVILAGYPAEMERMLKSNPGMMSRFTHHIEFDDYMPGELARIFALLCQQNEYVVRGVARAKLLAGLEWLYERRDEHFGNGRLVRNIFENAVRMLANRVVGEPTVTRQLLTHFVADDIQFDDVTPAVLDLERLKKNQYRVACDDCKSAAALSCEYLGRQVKCRQCGKRFRVEWPTLEPAT